jgi:double-stranded uracil-DNA glycosylase
VDVLAKYGADILAGGLDVVFCGLNPAASAVRAGYNFASPSNRFWTVLHRAGFTDVRLQPREERRLLKYGCGITSAVERPTRRADEISAEELRTACLALEAKIRCYAPRSVAFLGKRAFSIMMSEPDLDWGRQPTKFAETIAWLLPNPSGLNRAFPLDELVGAYSGLRVALGLRDLSRSSADSGTRLTGGAEEVRERPSKAQAVRRSDA